MIQYAIDRDEAIIDFVENDSMEKWRAFCRKYKMQRPKDSKAEKAAIYKMAQYCTQIPEETKTKAAVKCLQIGFNPFIDFGGK